MEWLNMSRAKCDSGRCLTNTKKKGFDTNDLLKSNCVSYILVF